MKKDLLVPDIGDFENVEIIELLVKQGQKISINDPIVTLESDKSSVEVPSTEEGIVESISVKIGDKVSKGDKLISISVEGGSEKNEEVKEVKKETDIPKDTEKIISDAEKVQKIEEPKIIRQEVSETKKTSKLENSKIEIVSDTNDIDPSETKEWLESLSAVLNSDGKERAQYIIRQLIEHSYREGSGLVMSRNTPYINTCLLYTSPSPRDMRRSRMPSSA